MRFLGQDEFTQVMGIGEPGEVRMGPDGDTYQWVQGVDGLGNTVGFWKQLKRFGRRVGRFVKKAVPVVQAIAPFFPGGAAVTAALRTATPFLKQAGILGVGGLGALYETPDGVVYQVQGLGQADEDLTQVMGIGALGEVRAGPGGDLYQWVEGVDGLGNTVGFWQHLRRIGRRVGRFVKKAAPILQKIAPLVPGGAAVSRALQTATPFLRQAGVLGADGFGGLYQAPDGSVYQTEGLGGQDEAVPPDEGWGVDGVLAAEDDLEGFGDGAETAGLDQVYVPEPELDGTGAYVPEGQPQQEPSSSACSVPPLWKPLW